MFSCSKIQITDAQKIFPQIWIGIKSHNERRGGTRNCFIPLEISYSEKIENFSREEYLIYGKHDVQEDTRTFLSKCKLNNEDNS